MSDNKSNGKFRTSNEAEASRQYSKIFEESRDSTEERLHNFIKYVRRQDLTKLLSRYEIFKQVLTVKGSVVECGVYRGAGLMSWSLFSDILEPVNLTRRIYGFDTFSGFPNASDKDANRLKTAKRGELSADSYGELQELVDAFDKNRFLSHIEKVRLIKGDAAVSIPKFIDENPHVVVSLLFLDFDLYEPTKIAIECFLERMPKGAIIAFDELDNPMWPGETLALLEQTGIRHFRIQRLPFDPYIGFAVIE